MEIRGGKLHIWTQYFDGLFWSIYTQRSKMKNRTPSFTRTFYSLHFVFACLKNIGEDLRLFSERRRKSRPLYLFIAIGLGRTDSQLRRPRFWLPLELARPQTPSPPPFPHVRNIGKVSTRHTERRNTKRKVRRQL